jgi:LPS-assembly protein
MDSAFSAVAIEPVNACVIVRSAPLTLSRRSHIADCLGWEANPANPICHGAYQPMTMTPLADANELQVMADEVSFYATGRSQLQGHVQIHESLRVVSAETAYIYRDAKTSQVTRIELLGSVRYMEPGRLLIAKSASLDPRDKSGRIEDALYRFDVPRAAAVLPAWGRASLIQRFANKNLLLRDATYSTCAPEDRAWQIEARDITLDNASETGVARNAVLRVADWPLLYTPYLSFPTSNARKSGFLMPMYGYSNVSGFDLAVPYYWNIAPNVDATIVPHEYSFRGTMLGGELRFLTPDSAGIVGGNILPHDRAFNEYLITHRDQYPQLNGVSTDRWSFLLHDSTQLARNLQMNIDYQQVSDAYYLQDFSSNLAIITENQLLRQGDVTYFTDHWLFRGMLQSYQTLHPADQQGRIDDAYDRLPQLLAKGSYDELPMHGHLNMLGQYDYFRLYNRYEPRPQGSRYHANPILSFPQLKPWGYITPEAELVENYYDLHSTDRFDVNQVNHSIPRLSIDSGLSFERRTAWLSRSYAQTLEPRLYYLYVPYQNQSTVPAFDSAYMIFNTNQLFRNNRFSGFDRIGDANQLAYAATSRFMSETTGQEKASMTIGQIRYFSRRKVKLCEAANGICIDNPREPRMLGYLSPVALYSPIASRATYQMNHDWSASGDYMWNPDTHATNNGDLNLAYRPAENKMLNFGYSYLVNGNELPTQPNALHQATLAYAWPLTETWSSLGAYSYNISEGYNMMYFAGLQYDTCCWAMRLLGGHTFQNLRPGAVTPDYNNNVYFQILLKGLGSVATSDPASTIQTYLPGYPNLFKR